MKDTETREILGMVKAATTQYPLDDQTVEFWLGGLSPLDAEIATRAVLAGIKTWEQFPPWAQFHEAYKMIQRRTQAVEAPYSVVEEGKRGTPPEWVWVWSWARFLREPREERAFPQQADFADPKRMLMREQYEALRDEWIATGSPKLKDPVGGMR